VHFAEDEKAGLALGHNLPRRPAIVDQLALHKVLKPTAKGHLAMSSVPLAARPISAPAKLRAIRLGGVYFRTAAPQFPPDRRGAAPRQRADRPKARSAPMLRRNHATFLAVEVLDRLSIATSCALRAVRAALETWA